MRKIYFVFFNSRISRPHIFRHFITQLVSNRGKEYMECSVGMFYIKIWGEPAKKVREEMLSKEWFGFDLDDTLHEFRKASRAASLATLLTIATKYEIPVEDLKETYARVLKRNTASAFTDGKTSNEYRKERFATVLDEFSVQREDSLLNKLAGTYKSTLEIALEPKPGAISLLKYLRSIGKKIAVITEGPQDAQEWTLQKLGFEVDYLATTNVFGLSKVNGLFGKVLEKLGVEAKDMVVVGDSEERDVIPARKEGILAVHSDEKSNLVLDLEGMKINTLWELEHILKGRDQQ